MNRLRRSTAIPGRTITVPCRLMRRNVRKPAIPVSAYIDGGTASMIFQLFIAGFLVTLFTLKSLWLRFKTFFINLLARRRSQVDK